MYLCESVEVTVDQSQQLHKLKTETKRKKKDDSERDELKWQQQIQKLTEENTQYKNTIQRLTHENKLLVARNKQLQSEFNRTDHDANQKNADANTSKNVNNTSTTTGKTNNHVYEVEQLVSHKIRNGSKYFLIRWKGYDASFDTWEREENLNCSKLLKKYLLSLKWFNDKTNNVFDSVCYDFLWREK